MKGSKKRKKKDANISGEGNRVSPGGNDAMRLFAEMQSPTLNPDQEVTGSYTIVPNYAASEPTSIKTESPEDRDRNVQPLLEEKAVTQRKIQVLRRRLAEEQEALARINAELKMQDEDSLASVPIATSPRSTQ